jgi:hypothetical protein
MLLDFLRWCVRKLEARYEMYAVGDYGMVYPMKQGESVQVEVHIRREQGTDESAGFAFKAPKTGHYRFQVDGRYGGLVRLPK